MNWLAKNGSAAVAYGLAAMFGLAAFSKATEFSEFASVLATSKLAPDLMAKPVAATILAIEGLTALALLVPTLRPFGFVSTFLLASIFGAYSVYRLVNKLPDPCHCFGPALRLDPAPMIAINFGIALLTAWIITGYPATDRFLRRIP